MDMGSAGLFVGVRSAAPHRGLCEAGLQRFPPAGRVAPGMDGNSRACKEALEERPTAISVGLRMTRRRAHLWLEVIEVSVRTVIYLMDYGDKTAEQPIWDRYVKWTATWAGKGEMLEHRETGSLVGNWQEVGLGENLGRALIANQGWLADASLISRVLNRCVGEQMCGQLKSIIAISAGPPYHVTLYRSGTTENHQVAQYSEKSLDLLAEKVAQFPKGTTFDLIPSSPQTGDQKALEDEARMIFTKSGMKLQAAR